MNYTRIFVIKKYCWLRVAVDRYEKRFIDFILGSRGYATGQLLWQNLEAKTIRWMMSDYWKVYPQIIPAAKLIQSKKETNAVGRKTEEKHFVTPNPCSCYL
ncbi:IS1 family transposase [Rhodocytophaga rosea]|uniref:IS1 family transposase n=1 Tax=Rhodocytophaga rosea TaxID=2704465 RepID=A0A6C0GCD0_9BACT|nr:IS1 family transposase [Rhodocytophaga rosea]QHT65330.1 IS1 family transposase [Rhodocytophaga rosea]